MRDNSLIIDSFQISNNLQRIDIVLEEIANIRKQIKTDLDIILIVLPPEFFQNICFANLAGSLKYEGLMIRPVLPVYEPLSDFSFHSNYSH